MDGRPARRAQEAEQEVDMQKPRNILTLGGLVEPPTPARPKQAWRDAICALADAGLPLFDRMREGRCLPMKIAIWREIASRTDPIPNAALKAELAVLSNSRPYIAACAANGAMRHDVDGHAVEPVAAEHQHWAMHRRSGGKK
jgi:ProP effector